MRRGDLVTVALQGEHGKPRPALVIQSDQFPGTRTVAVLPITSTIVEAPLLRLTLDPTTENGLRVPSQVMIDKIVTVGVAKISTPFGRVEDATMIAINRSLMVFLGMTD